MRIQIYTDPLCWAHDSGAGHPERPARLTAIFERLDALPQLDAERPQIQPATRAQLVRVHTPAYVDRVLGTRGTPTMFDGDTQTSADSVDAALIAAGGVIDATLAALAQPTIAPFALVRPPGHHAEADRAMGFCLFNNVAVAAAEAKQHPGVERILIFDPDVHHGNGTQHLFAADPDVYYISIHRAPYYPGTGAVDEVGDHAGHGTTANFPLPAGSGDGHYLGIVRHFVLPVIRRWKPDLILLSAGFDAHERDLMGGMAVTTNGFRALFGMVYAAAAAEKTPTVFALEGGYDLVALGDSVAAVVDAVASEAWPNDDAGALLPHAVRKQIEALHHRVRPFTTEATA